MPRGAEGDGPPDFVGVRDRVIDAVLAFARELRRQGAEVPANAAIDATRALVEVGFDDRERVRSAMRAALVSRQEDLATFDDLFPAFWHRLDADGGGTDAETPHDDGPEPLAIPSRKRTSEEERADGADEPEGAGRRQPVESRLEPAEADAEGEQGETAVYSPTGRSERVTDELSLAGSDDDLDAPMRLLTAALAELQGRRWGRRGDRRVDVRRALRGTFGTGGTVVSVPTHGRKRSGVRAVLLVDVSQSVLDIIDRGFLLRFLRRAAEEWRSVRVFFFDTSVREVTDAFRAPTPEDALAALTAAETAWGGGTRIGKAIETVRSRYPEAVDHHTTTFVISDGLEVGEIDRLEAGMSWLSSRSGSVLWCNPLAASPEYEPTCRGMAAALPYVDGVFAFTGPGDLAEMARQLDRHGPGGPVGYEYDARGRP